jgi:DnaJ domain
MTHYEALGVGSDASADQIRTAYLRLARQYHPDRHGTDDVATRRAAELRMRDVNAAWAVLGDADRRGEYDRRVLRLDDTIGNDPEPRGPVVARPSRDFSPYHAVDEDDDDRWRYEPDEGDPATNPGRLFTVAPAALLVVGFAFVVFGLTTRARPFVAVAVICLVVAALLFLGAPLVALFKSQAHENRPRRG